MKAKIKYVIERDIQLKYSLKEWVINCFRLKFSRLKPMATMYVQIEGNQYGYAKTVGEARPFSKFEAIEFVKAVNNPELRIKRVMKSHGKYYLQSID